VPRVEVDGSLEPVAIPAWIVNELLKHARESLPEECCGLVFGARARDYARRVGCLNAMNLRHDEDPQAFPRDARTAFWISPEDYLEACTEAGRRGERLTAVYHSHVGSDAYLSELDLDYADPGADQIVIAVPAPDAEHLSLRIGEDGCAAGIGIFVWDAEQRGFRGHRARLGAP
jgi:proteasome lid subunit RPN8/RPN11